MNIEVASQPCGRHPPPTNPYGVKQPSATRESRTREVQAEAFEGCALGHLQRNPRHPGLNTHKYTFISVPNGEEVFETYAENRTPAAYRIFWIYGPDEKMLTVVAITPPSDLSPPGFIPAARVAR